MHSEEPPNPPIAETPLVQPDSTPPAESPIVQLEPGSFYCIRYEGNNSKKWDGKEILTQAEELETHSATGHWWRGKL